MTRCQTALLGALLGTMGVAWGATAAEVQQPVRGVRVASKVSSFYTDEILGSEYDSNDVLLEHPSNPKSMRQSGSVAQATSADEIPTQHLFADDVSKPATKSDSDGTVPPPPGSNAESKSESVQSDITPIPAGPTAKKTVPSTPTYSPSYTDPWPAASSAEVIQQPVTISNSVEGVRVETVPVADEYTVMGPGCS